MSSSPLCCVWVELFGPCPYQGQVIYGPPDAEGDAVNRSMTCARCGVRGEESVNLAPPKPPKGQVSA